MTAAVKNSARPTPPASPPSPVDDLDVPTGLFRHSLLNHAMGTYLPATVAARLINFARILLLTWWMTTQQFGLLAMILLSMNVMTPLCSLGLSEAVARYVPQHETRGSLWLFMLRSARVLLVITLVSVAMMIAFSSFLGVFLYAQVFTDPKVFAEFCAEAPQLARLSAIVIGLMIAYFFLLAFLKGLRMFTALAVMEISHSMLFLAGAAVAWWMHHLSALTLTGIYGISMAIPVVLFGGGLVRAVSRWRFQHEPLSDKRVARTLLKFSIWATLAGVTWQILVAYPAWFLNKVHGNEAVGVFHALRQVGQFILIGAVAVTTVIMTTVTKTWETRGREAALRQLSLAFRGTGLGLLVLCAIIALSKDIISQAFRPDFAPGAAILPLHVLFFLMAAFLAFLSIHFHLVERTRHMFWPWAIGVAANVLFAIWLATPKLATVQGFAVWKAASHVTLAIFTTGFSDPQGLDSAAWCGVFAIATALTLCIILIRTECTELDRGVYIVIVSAFLLATKPVILSTGVVALLALAFGTELIFNRDERRRITGYVLGALSHVPPFRLLWGRKGGDT
ncbi:MAG: lipopolysaccharide biosynthesis protein [Planctomycetota bacterium]